MSEPAIGALPGRRRERAAVLSAAAVLALAAVAAYSNSLGAPFLFLDLPAIVDNPTIRHLWPLTGVLMPPAAGGVTVGGRPILNLSFALNHAFGGTGVRGYHEVNLAIHVLAGLTLFGIVRRTLLRWSELLAAAKSSKFEDEDGSSTRSQGLGASKRVEDNSLHLDPGDATWLSFAIALLWTLHPLQTESVTWVVQRAESLMGLFYLLTIYCFIRYVGHGSGAGVLPDRTRTAATLSRARTGPPSCVPPGGTSEGLPDEAPPCGAEEVGQSVRAMWAALCVLACLFGMATKEVMVSAPLIVFLYDSTFVSGGFLKSWNRRWRFYITLASTWIVLALLIMSTGGDRGGTSGFGLGIPWGKYVLTQFPAVVQYLRLSFLPVGLDFHYGAQWVDHPARILPAAAVVILLAVASAWGLVRSHPAGVAGVFFFAILAPTSLVPGATQTMAEHRMYLALAAVIAAAAWAAWGILGWTVGKPAAARILGAILIAAAAGCGWLTHRRNEVYRGEIPLWSDTVARSPGNPYPFNNLGIALVNAGRREEAVANFRRAIELNPAYPEARNNLGLALVDSGQVPEAITQYEEALRLRPGYGEAEANLGVALAKEGRLPEAIRRLEEAVRLEPLLAGAHNNLAVALAGAGRLPEAIAQYETVLRLDPAHAEVHYNLGNALLGVGRLGDAIAHYEEALRLRPDYPEAEANLGAALASCGRLAEAVAHYEAALRLDPSDADVRTNLEQALRALGRQGEGGR